MFFKEVGFLQLRTGRYFILGRGPRRSISPADLQLPGFLESGKG